MGGLNSNFATDPNLLAGFGANDDAAVYRLNNDRAAVLTVDFFAPVVDDPHSYGYIAAANAMSDVYAVGGVPALALNIACFPRTLDPQVTRAILRGGSDAAKDAGALVVGGHTVEDDEPKYGMAVVGFVVTGKQVGHDGARPGDQVILTKPLGSGIITTALKAGAASEDELERATTIMKSLNLDASAAMNSVGANACTDITGYGLMGHILNIAEASEATIEINAPEVPIIEGATRLADEGCVSGGTNRNLDEAASYVSWDPGVSELTRLLLCDAQTSGGLAIVVPPDSAATLDTELQRRGVESWTIGQVIPQKQHAVSVTS